MDAFGAGTMSYLFCLLKILFKRQKYILEVEKFKKYTKELQVLFLSAPFFNPTPIPREGHINSLLYIFPEPSICKLNDASKSANVY